LITKLSKHQEPKRKITSTLFIFFTRKKENCCLYSCIKNREHGTWWILREDKTRKKRLERRGDKKKKKRGGRGEPLVSSQRKQRRQNRERGRHRISFNHLFTIFNNSSDLHHHWPSSSYASLFSNNVTSNSLGKEDQGRCRKTELGEQASIQPTAPNIFVVTHF
jgi:hypothetical protein